MSETARKTNYTGLARRLNRISPEHKKVAIEMTANLAGVSLRVSKTFVEATPKGVKFCRPTICGIGRKWDANWRWQTPNQVRNTLKKVSRILRKFPKNLAGLCFKSASDNLFYPVRLRLKRLNQSRIWLAKLLTNNCLPRFCKLRMMSPNVPPSIRQTF
jgi:hypothetical protein